MSTPDPNKTILTGENPFLSLSAKDGEPNCNPFGLAPGDVARIDEKYLEAAHRLCWNRVVRLASWAE